MPVDVKRQGPNYEVTVTFTRASVPGKQGDYLPSQWMALVLVEAMEEIGRSRAVAGSSDTDLDAEYARRSADLDAEKAARKAARATGNL